MLSQKWDVSRFWDTNPPFNGRRGENGDDGSSDLAADSPELRSSRPGFRPDASNCGQTTLVRNRTRSVAKKTAIFHRGCRQSRRTNTWAPRDAFTCDQIVRVRTRERSVTSKPASRCCSRIVAHGPDPLSRKGALCQRGGQEAADINNC